MQQLPQLARRGHLDESLHCWQEAAVVPHRQHHPGLPAGQGHLDRLRMVQGQRLLDIDGLAGLRASQGLLDVLAVRRRQHDRVDAGVAQQGLEVLGKVEAMLRRELTCLVGRAVPAANEPDALTAAGSTCALHGVDQPPAPAPEADDRGPDHCVRPAHITAPPSITITEPVTNADSSLARYTAISAISSGRPMRPKG